jgi:hypothetical protein
LIEAGCAGKATAEATAAANAAKPVLPYNGADGNGRIFLLFLFPVFGKVSNGKIRPVKG